MDRCIRCMIDDVVPMTDYCMDCSNMKSFIIKITHKETKRINEYLILARTMKEAGEKAKKYIKGNLKDYKATGRLAHKHG